ncbi:hypothetical protein [Mycobacteroides salmoniphilum]|uniref:hypothetical protein n=1 Tax=Mycobacteroides salmoniphilum TaxID=404941 RepID=UPI0010648FD5|nr:hypothetical protein [Mycobacteroides salmoniphilum]TDZ77064.1 hypothetical protein DE4586_02850 [Mycobacteroides salmoniphilum]TDZ86767.1 hypothetical protein DE4587_02154 [Mycobacteroides salmoniphilum]
MSLLRRLRDRMPATPELEPDPSPSIGCRKCEPAIKRRGPKFGGHVAARGRGLPVDNGLRVI